MLVIALLMTVGWSRPCGAESALFHGEGVIYGGIGAEYSLNSLQYSPMSSGETDSIYSTHSKRFLVMSSYGLTRWMEVFGQLGMADLEIEAPSGRTDLQGDYTIAVGAGVRVRLLDLFGSRVLLYGEGSGTLFPFEGPKHTGTGTIQEYYWFEGEAALGMEMAAIGFYAGAGVQELETHPSYLIEGETYRSGARWLGFIGKSFSLRNRFRLDIRVTGPEMISIRIALTQRFQSYKDPF
jgi:hypothetical protein